MNSSSEDKILSEIMQNANKAVEYLDEIIVNLKNAINFTKHKDLKTYFRYFLIETNNVRKTLNNQKLNDDNIDNIYNFLENANKASEQLEDMITSLKDAVNSTSDKKLKKYLDYFVKSMYSVSIHLDTSTSKYYSDPGSNSDSDSDSDY